MCKYISILLMVPFFLIAEEPKEERARFHEIQVDYNGHVWDVVMLKHSADCDCND